MTILMLNTLYYPSQVGGAERSVQLLAEDLVDKGHKVIVACLSDKEKRIFKHNGVVVYSILNNNIYWPFSKNITKKSIFSKIIWHILDTYANLQVKQILRIIKDEKPNLVSINNISGFSTRILKSIKQHNLPIAQTLRDYHYLCIKNSCYNDGNCIQLCKACAITSQFKLKQLNAYVNHIICISEFVKSKHQMHGLNATIPISVIPNAIKDSLSNSCEKKKSNGIKKFGFIGAVNEPKGVEHMLQLFNDPSLQEFKFEILIAGEGSSTFLKKLKNDFEHLHVKFLGYQEPSAFYRSIDALIVPSLWHEPFGRVVIEGTQHQLPIFVSNNGALPELRHKIKGIKSFHLKNIKQFLNTPNDQCYRYNLDEFSSKKISESYEILFYKILQNEN